MPEVRFDERVAAAYDANATAMFDPAVVEPAVAVLAELAGSGAALELGVGTGRIALPLSRRGVPVHGVDISPPMLEQLRAKPGAERIGLTVGDFATTKVDRTFRLAYLVYNTISNLVTQDEQVACFQNVADHLEPGGCFVLECEVPDLRRLPPGETVRAFDVTPPHLGLRPVRAGRRAGPVVPPLLGPRRPGGAVLRSLPLRLALRARPHGPARWSAAAGPLERLAPGAVHPREHVPRLGVGEAVLALRSASWRDR